MKEKPDQVLEDVLGVAGVRQAAATQAAK